MPDDVGQQLGSYQLIRMLGQGQWGSVYLGEHLHLRTQAAIKLLHGPWDEREVAGFLSEARTLAHLRHPHIVRVLDFGVQQGTPYLVMEYAPGGTLRRLHPRGMRLPLQTVVAYLKQVASALQYAHDQRLIHRDLKPENLLLGQDQQIWLADFGLAAPSARSQHVQQTAGTLAYMALEQLCGHATAASDQYALGVLVYEWLAGERPFSGSSAQLAVQQALASPPPLREQVPTLSPLVERAVARALAKDPDARFSSVEAFARALEEASLEDAAGRTMSAPEAYYVAARLPSSHALPSGTITLLFADMEGSTRLLQHLSDRYEELLADYRRLMRTAIEQCNGYEVDTQGDAFFVAFARATNAIGAAVDMQRALAAVGRGAGAHRAAYRRTATRRRGLCGAGCPSRCPYHERQPRRADPPLVFGALELFLNHAIILSLSTWLLALALLTGTAACANWYTGWRAQEESENSRLLRLRSGWRRRFGILSTLGFSCLSLLLAVISWVAGVEATASLPTGRGVLALVIALLAGAGLGTYLFFNQRNWRQIVAYARSGRLPNRDETPAQEERSP